MSIAKTSERAKILDLATGRPFQAEGRIRLDLTDPVTGKVKERVEGKNHVFKESLLSAWNSVNWWEDVSAMWLCLNDSSDSIATDFPYLLGQTVGRCSSSARRATASSDQSRPSSYRGRRSQGASVSWRGRWMI